MGHCPEPESLPRCGWFAGTRHGHSGVAWRSARRSPVTTEQRRRRLGAALAALWLVVVLVIDLLAHRPTLVMAPLYAIGPLIACAVPPAAPTAAFGGAAVLLATWSNLWGGAWGTPQVWVRIVDVTLVSTAAVVVSAVRVRRERQLARVERIAEVAQRTVLPLIPRQVGPVTTGARYLSAAEDTLEARPCDWFHSTGASASWWATCAARESAPSSRRLASSAPSASPLPPAPTWPPWRGR